jgi:hypothetical protein
MRHLIVSFQRHSGFRGVHFYSEDSCNFLTWDDVYRFLSSLPNEGGTSDEFEERLLSSLANYNPDSEFLAVRQSESTVSVELYTRL